MTSGHTGDESSGAFFLAAVAAAIWLFGSALAGLGWLPRKTQAKLLPKLKHIKRGTDPGFFVRTNPDLASEPCLSQ